METKRPLDSGYQFTNNNPHIVINNMYFYSWGESEFVVEMEMNGVLVRVSQNCQPIKVKKRMIPQGVHLTPYDTYEEKDANIYLQVEGDLFVWALSPEMEECKALFVQINQDYSAWFEEQMKVEMEVQRLGGLNRRSAIVARLANAETTSIADNEVHVLDSVGRLW